MQHHLTPLPSAEWPQMAKKMVIGYVPRLSFDGVKFRNLLNRRYYATVNGITKPDVNFDARRSSIPVSSSKWIDFNGDIPEIEKGFTVACWHYDYGTGTSYILGDKGSDASLMGFSVAVNNYSGNCRLVFSNGGYQYDVVSLGSSVEKWRHICVTYKQLVLTVYVDGVYVGVANGLWYYPINANHAGSYTIGRYVTGGDACKIGNWFLFSRAISAKTVKSLYRGFSPFTERQPMALAWNFIVLGSGSTSGTSSAVGTPIVDSFLEGETLGTSSATGTIGEDRPAQGATYGTSSAVYIRSPRTRIMFNPSLSTGPNSAEMKQTRTSAVLKDTQID